MVLFEDPEEVDGEIDHPLPKDLMFDQWATLAASAMPHIVAVLRVVLEALQPEGRKPRRELIDGIEAIVPTVVANLVVLHQTRPHGSRLVVEMERRRKTRYDRKGFRKLTDIIKVLEAAGLIVVHQAVFKQRRTAIEATSNLRQLLSDIGLADISRAEGEETILLTARPLVRRIAGSKQPKVPVDYGDTEESIRLRAEMEEINRFLASHRVSLQDEPVPAFRLVRIFSLRGLGDPLGFTLHGRLYGGFWMSLKASERSRLRIDGEPIADLDFSSMFPNLAYRHVGKPPPQGDLYAIPGLENHRDGAKAAMSALLSYEAEMKSLPSRLKAQLPDGWTASRVKKAFAAFHPELVPLFGRDFGLHLMFTESRILITTLRRLMAQDIPALPMHDGIMVQSARVEEATAAMELASREIIDIALTVSRKSVGRGN